MAIDRGEALSFDDVMLIPQYSRVESRRKVDLTMELDSKWSLELPIIASPMDTICESDMAIAMAEAGGIGIIHRYVDVYTQEDLIKKFKSVMPHRPVGVAIGAVSWANRAARLVSAGADILLVDVAHGHHKNVADCVDYLRTNYGDTVHIMAGNVATEFGFSFLENTGAHSIRVGVGGGSCCTTRIVSGHGIPTLESIKRITDSRKNREAKVIADGGIRNTGDMAKAFAFGADFVMLGSMLAGTEETPGESWYPEGEKSGPVKKFRGMASADAQTDWRPTVDPIAEGISGVVPLRGSVVDILAQIKDGLGSACSYSGVDKLRDLYDAADYVKITSNGLRESHPHQKEKFV